MIVALLYSLRVHLLSQARAEITLVPTWLGRLLKRRTRVGTARRARDEYGEWVWWWTATDRYVGTYIERYIEAAPILQIEDMSVEQLLFEEPADRKSS